MRVYLGSTANMSNSTFLENEAYLDGGAVAVYKNSILEIQSTTFELNVAKFGGVFTVYPSMLMLTDSRFSNNTGEIAGVMRLLEQSFVTVTRSSFIHNRAHHGGVVYGDNCVIQIAMGYFGYNMATLNGGIVYIVNNASVVFDNSDFIGNNAAGGDGGVMNFYSHTIAFIDNCNFMDNRAQRNGGVANLQFSDIGFSRTTFHFSYAGNNGGVLSGVNVTVVFNDSYFFDSKASDYGGAISLLMSDLKVFKCEFINNTVGKYGGAMSIIYQSKGTLGEYTFTHNRATEQNGGAVSLYAGSKVNISKCLFSHNEARQSGAGVAAETFCSVFFDTFPTDQAVLHQTATNRDVLGSQILNNTAFTRSGGGIVLIQSSLHLRAWVNIRRNEAHGDGGGIYATANSDIIVGSMVFVTNNSAKYGGGVSLSNSELFDADDCEDKTPSIHFVSNQAERGGALYINDDRDNGTCSNGPLVSNMCFFGKVKMESMINFDDNDATVSGQNLYGGLLDRCVGEVNIANHTTSGGITRFLEISNLDISNRDTIGSEPVKLCFCEKNKLNCGQDTPLLIDVARGDSFTIQVAAIDQVGHPVKAKVQSSIRDITLPASQAARNIDAACSSLEYQVSLPRTSINHYLLTLFAVGPCSGEGISKLRVDVRIRSCDCGHGFMPQNNTIACDCICDTSDEEFSNYIKECDSNTRSVIRKGLFWIAYLHTDTSENASHYLISPYCPFDYCRSSIMPVLVNLNLPNGSDAQCTNNRGGLLCGKCIRPTYSLSLGSSKCLECPNYWYANLVVITIVAILAGPIVVALLLLLNLTVAVGTLNSIIFYANIINANNNVYFRHPHLAPASTFVSWLNLEVGIDVCFFDGMDTYGKTWINILFPLYIIFLVVMVIWVSSRSSRFSNLIGKRNPVATLATLMLLSYTRLLQTVIVSISFSKLRYPNGTEEFLWLPQASIGFVGFEDWLKLGALIILATIILIATLSFTITLLFWQCLVRYSQLRIFKWTRNPKLRNAIETYHAPYNARHRYWTGLLLIIRVIVYLIAASTASIGRPITLLSTVFLMCCLILYKTAVVTRVYRNMLTDVIDSAMYFNIAIFALVTLYAQIIIPGYRDEILLEEFQSVVTYVSVIATFMLLAGVIIFHAYRYGSTKIYKCFGHKSKLNQVISSQTSNESNQVIFETSENVFLDAIDSPRTNYSSPFIKLPTTTSFSLPARKASCVQKSRKDKSENEGDSTSLSQGLVN